MALLIDNEVCGTCKHHYYDKEEQEWVCDCALSDRCGEFTEYGETCNEWEDKTE